eukprot:Cvel_25377.t1-p1 / transcript=Cvel_25377.t1 / gene=Cvel_25377 / organism=Chromera_velia_CCMP2878 / gene_product=Keratin-associated protein 5-1, putative / transcript_product=Keratin-associated protein 5-1, putative / location=Cvel_scaffold2867:1-8048(-) / protein_length=1289 / sequence_SO=supercontig / SO=protein_coding / is_pseudo=false
MMMSSFWLCLNLLLPLELSGQNIQLDRDDDLVVLQLATLNQSASIEFGAKKFRGSFDIGPFDKSTKHEPTTKKKDPLSISGSDEGPVGFELAVGPGGLTGEVEMDAERSRFDWKSLFDFKLEERMDDPVIESVLGVSQTFFPSLENLFSPQAESGGGSSRNPPGEGFIRVEREPGLAATSESGNDTAGRVAQLFLGDDPIQVQGDGVLWVVEDPVTVWVEGQALEVQFAQQSDGTIRLIFPYALEAFELHCDSWGAGIYSFYTSNEIPLPILRRARFDRPGDAVVNDTKLIVANEPASGVLFFPGPFQEILLPPPLPLRPKYASGSIDTTINDVNSSSNQSSSSPTRRRLTRRRGFSRILWVIRNILSFLECRVGRDNECLNGGVCKFGGCDCAAVVREPLAEADALEVEEDSLDVRVDVLANDRDLNGGELTITGVGDAAFGEVKLIDGGTALSYTPQRDYFGPDQFAYIVSNDAGLSASAVVTVEVLPVNDPPTVENESFQVVEGGNPLRSSVLLNDFDVDSPSQALVVTLEEDVGPAFGFLELSRNGDFTFFPASGTPGDAVLSYRVSDQSLSSTGVATITINPSFVENANTGFEEAPDGAGVKADLGVATLSVVPSSSASTPATVALGTEVVSLTSEDFGLRLPEGETLSVVPVIQSAGSAEVGVTLDPDILGDRDAEDTVVVLDLLAIDWPPGSFTFGLPFFAKSGFKGVPTRSGKALELTATSRGTLTFVARLPAFPLGLAFTPADSATVPGTGGARRLTGESIAYTHQTSIAGAPPPALPGDRCSTNYDCLASDPPNLLCSLRDSACCLPLADTGDQPACGSPEECCSNNCVNGFCAPISSCDELGGGPSADSFCCGVECASCETECSSGPCCVSDPVFAERKCSAAGGVLQRCEIVETSCVGPEEACRVGQPGDCCSGICSDDRPLSTSSSEGVCKSAAGDQCRSDADCVRPLACDGGRCCASGGGRCVDSRDCCGEFVCDSGGQCKGGLGSSCIADTDCTDGLECSGQSLDCCGSIGSACVVGPDCCSGECTDGSCADADPPIPPECANGGEAGLAVNGVLVEGLEGDTKRDYPVHAAGSAARLDFVFTHEENTGAGGQTKVAIAGFPLPTATEALIGSQDPSTILVDVISLSESFDPSTDCANSGLPVFDAEAGGWRVECATLPGQRFVIRISFESLTPCLNCAVGASFRDFQGCSLAAATIIAADDIARIDGIRQATEAELKTVRSAEAQQGGKSRRRAEPSPSCSSSCFEMLLRGVNTPGREGGQRERRGASSGGGG